jgi:hypothetical protein
MDCESGLPGMGRALIVATKLQGAAQACFRSTEARCKVK